MQATCLSAAAPAAAAVCCGRPRATRALIRPARLLGAPRRAAAAPRAQAADAPPAPKPAAAKCARCCGFLPVHLPRCCQLPTNILQEFVSQLLWRCFAAVPPRPPASCRSRSLPPPSPLPFASPACALRSAPAA